MCLSSLTTNLAFLFKKYFTASTRSFLRLQAYRFTPWSIENKLNMNTNNSLLCKGSARSLCIVTFYYII